MATNSDNINVSNLIRRIVREEVRMLFTLDQKNTSKNNQVTYDEAPTGGIVRKRRKRRSFKKNVLSKGRVTSPNDKRLKANREA